MPGCVRSLLITLAMAVGTLSVCSAAWVFGLIPPFSSVDGRSVIGILSIIVVGVFIAGFRAVEDVIRSKAAGQHINSDAAFWFSVLIGSLGGGVVFLVMWIVGEWQKGL